MNASSVLHDVAATLLQCHCCQYSILALFSVISLIDKANKCPLCVTRAMFDGVVMLVNS